MKKILLITALFIICTSCSQEELGTNNESAKNENVIAFGEDKLITELQALNDSLISTKSSESRGRFLDFFRRVCNVVKADIYGGISGANEAREKGYGKVAIWIYGVFGSIKDSFQAGKTEFSRAVIDDLDIKDVEAAYSQVIQAEQTNPELKYIKLNADLRLPEEFKHTTEMGKVHNLTLACLNSDNYDLASYEPQLNRLELTIINSQNFIEFYYTNRVVDIDLNRTDLSKEEYVIKLFIDAYSEYPEDSEDVSELINLYIDKIEADNTINTDERECIYYALSIAAYSTEYWKEKLETETNN